MRPLFATARHDVLLDGGSAAGDEVVDRRLEQRTVDSHPAYPRLRD
jgi:hypothetical protein